MDGTVESSAPQTPEPGLAQLLLDALPSCALVVDPEGRIVALNLQAERVLGWGAAVLEGQFAHEILDCHDEESAHSSDGCPIARVLTGASGRPQGTMRVRCRDQAFKPIEYGCASYPTSQGRGAILAFRDLTCQIDLEKEFRRLASIAEASPIAIVELNEDANLLHANPQMMSLLQRFGFSSGARPAILPANIEKLTTQCLKTQSEIGGIEVGVKKKYYEWKLVPVNGEKIVRGYGIDITTRKQAEIELLQAKAKAEAGMKAKTEFLANTKHEIRSPVYVISGMADLLVESALNQDQLEYVNTIRASAESLMRVIENILDMAALEEGATRFEATAVNFRSFLSEITAPYAKEAENKALQFLLTVSHKIPGTVRCERKRLAQLLNNIVSNAVKFTERGEVVVEVDRDAICSTSTGTEDERVREKKFYLFFSVRDTGIGIPPEKQEGIFDCFAQADGSSTRSYEGTGLGLAISKQMLELMGGTIGVESEPGKGSRFWFSFPVEASSEATTITTKATLRESTAPR